jgi:hypothetical protein
VLPGKSRIGYADLRGAAIGGLISRSHQSVTMVTFHSWNVASRRRSCPAAGLWPLSNIRIMGALKPWHMVVLTVLCLLPLAAAIAGIWVARRSKRRP